MRRKTQATTVASTVSVEVSNHDGKAAQIDAQLSYDPADPLAVTITFQDERGPIPWTFGRDLLMEGLYSPAGDGDVHIWPCLSKSGDAVVMFELAARDGGVLVEIGSRQVTHFVSSTLASVPRGREAGLYDVDAALQAILA